MQNQCIVLVFQIIMHLFGWHGLMGLFVASIHILGVDVKLSPDDNRSTAVDVVE